ncbi:hypothetical protein D3C81_750270 [compost metagenome]
MAGGDIDAHRPGVPGLLPALHLSHGLSDHPLADVDNQVGFFHQWQEIGRRHQALEWVLPTQQGFETKHLATAHVDLGLVMQAQLALDQGLTYPCHGLMGRFDLTVQRHVEQMIAVAATLLGHVQRLIGMAHQGVGIFVVEREQGHADAGTDTDLTITNRIRRGDRLEHALQRRLQLLGLLHMAQDQHKFVAREPRHRVADAQNTLQAIGHLHQQ